MIVNWCPQAAKGGVPLLDSYIIENRSISFGIESKCRLKWGILLGWGLTMAKNKTDSMHKIVMVTAAYQTKTPAQ